MISTLITAATVPTMTTDAIRSSLETMMDDDATAETVTALRARFAATLADIRRERAEGRHASFGESMESGAAGKLALADEYLARVGR